MDGVKSGNTGVLMVIPRVLAKVTGNLHQSRCTAKGLGWMGESRQDGGPPQQFVVVQMAQHGPEQRFYLGIRNYPWQTANLLCGFSYSQHQRHLLPIGAPRPLSFEPRDVVEVLGRPWISPSLGAPAVSPGPP